MVKPPCSTFRMITANFSGLRMFMSFTVRVPVASARGISFCMFDPVIVPFGCAVSELGSVHVAVGTHCGTRQHWSLGSVTRVQLAGRGG